jgi:hypothetical protein
VAVSDQMSGDTSHAADRDADRDADVEDHVTPSDTRLAGLLRDLGTLRQYLDERGRHAYELAQRFLANAARDPTSRAYDERQATMLEYQHYIWHEIAGRVGQLLAAYGVAGEDGQDEDTAMSEDGAQRRDEG